MASTRTTSSDAPSAADGGRLRLVIVESPAKARTIAGYLGPGYVVESSIGHIRDLPSSSAEIPAEKKKEPWARLGVDVDHGFEPLYVVNPDKKQQVAKLKSALKDADELLLATDEDREGEAIAWHLLEVLKPRVPVRRMVFHEITPQAIREAVEHPREINRALVDAQETRRILDRLYGYEVSPVLWKKVMPRLSAGRVQSVATRLLVERERARMRFRSAGYWDLEAEFHVVATADGDPAADDGDPRSFTATLVGLDGRRVATGRDFGETGELTADRDGKDAPVHLDASAAATLADRLRAATFHVRSVEQRPYRRSPYAPFITSTLQQEASRKLRFSAQVTMRLAQRLYENGYITYMRTDSTTLSETALAAARDQARELYGAAYVPDAPRRYERKVKNAQEAHEAIRPAGDRFRTPNQVRGEVSADEFRLYELIWQRTVASQMADATGQSVSVRVTGVTGDGATPTSAEFSATGKVITFPGFLRAYVEETDDEQTEREDRERRLPQLSEGQPLDATGIEPQEHATNPPARYTEASLVKALEELGIGRPSTYASILGTIQDRGYVFKRGTALVPSFTAFAVVGLLERHFGRLVDYGFTAEMEDDLDEIATGERERAQWLGEFYFGTGAGDSDEGLKELVHHRLGEIDAREVNSIPVGVTDDGEPIVVRVGRYGPYVQKGADGETSDRASVPEDLPPDELTVEKALSLLQKQSDERLLGQHPETGEPIVARGGRYGPYVTTQPLNGGEARTASLLKTMSIETVTLDDALRLLSLPRSLGLDPGTGEEMTVQNGRYGPYVKRGTDSRSLDNEEQLFSLTRDEALALLAQPKTRGRRAAAAPLRELGADPATQRPVVVKEGRFGPYVTDGETNASLRKGDSVEEITIDRATELLAERRAKGPATPRKRSGRTAKSAAAPTAKKAAKKATKTATKKAAKRTSPGSAEDAASD
ncbi:MAG TPA: type I DNA topoisomerase [Mycobacteriales bacterium]|nr:type I DNA topoisomerase [Mycobacteriales bacterium]